MARFRRSTRSTGLPTLLDVLTLSIFLNIFLSLVLIWSFSFQDTSIGQSKHVSKRLAWHGGHSNTGQQGSCVCNSVEFCLCTPNLAVDVVLVTAKNTLLLVRRKDTNQIATLGGFVEVGETIEAAVRRELEEEMNIHLHKSSLMELIGVYSDPRRDNRRHTVSVVYAVHLPPNVRPVAATDAKDVVEIDLEDIARHDYFADHRVMLLDYYRMHHDLQTPVDFVGDATTKIIRSTCPIFNQSSFISAWR